MTSAISTAARDTDRRDLRHHPFGVTGAHNHQIATSTSQPIRAEGPDRRRGRFMGGKIVADLKLGPLPKHSAMRVTVVLSEPLKEELDAYAAEHSKLYEPVETAALIPHMLEAFLRTDRAWCCRRKHRARASRSTSNQLDQRCKHE
jgi:hypothetical protein